MGSPLWARNKNETRECIGIWSVRWIVAISNFICRSTNSTTHTQKNRMLVKMNMCIGVCVWVSGPRAKVDFYVKSTNWKLVASYRPLCIYVLSSNNYFANSKHDRCFQKWLQMVEFWTFIRRADAHTHTRPSNYFIWHCKCNEFWGIVHIRFHSRLPCSRHSLFSMSWLLHCNWMRFAVK